MKLSLEPAFRIAIAVHGNQVDLQDEPYLFHVCRVAMAMKTDVERVVGVLHDVLEDGGRDWEPVIAVEYPVEVFDAVEALTHREQETYKEYVQRLSANPIAVRVKIADLRDNLRGERLKLLNPQTMARLVDKYVPALEFLEAL